MASNFRPILTQPKWPSTRRHNSLAICVATPTAAPIRTEVAGDTRAQNRTFVAFGRRFKTQQASTRCDFRIASPTRPYICGLTPKGWVLGLEIAAGNRKSLAMFHRTLETKCSNVLVCLLHHWRVPVSATGCIKQEKKAKRTNGTHFTRVHLPPPPIDCGFGLPLCEKQTRICGSAPLWDDEVGPLSICNGHASDRVAKQT